MAHILIAEDDRQIASLLARLSARFGHTSHIVYDGLSALSLIDTSPFDLLITDLNLPVLSGADLMQRLQARTSRPKIIACSGLTQQGEVAALADGVLAKPFMMDELRALLDELFPETGLKRPPVRQYQPMALPDGASQSYAHT